MLAESVLIEYWLLETWRLVVASENHLQKFLVGHLENETANRP